MDAICKRLELWRQGNLPHFIHEFETSIFVVGEHQHYEGYSLLYLKEHVENLVDLDPKTNQQLALELQIASGAVIAAFNPWKLNYQLIGNKAQHIHWHILPRYESDPYQKELPFYDVIKAQLDLSKTSITHQQAADVAGQIRAQLPL